MRSFVGLLHDDGTPPDARLLRHVASALRLPTSSAPALRIDGGCGLAVVSHRGDGVPPLHESSLLFAGDVRLDGPESRASDPDAVVLHAWKRWQTDCVEHLFGDYSFALWDGAAGVLFCARDRFGVRPFYYARTSRGLIVSDSLEAVLAHPDVDAAGMDDGAVADYLAGGVPEDAEATIYANVRRLPPAHVLHRRGGETVLRRYWTLSAPRVEAHQVDAPERLEAALREAIADRVTDSAAVVFMSGGLDSPALAALAREVRPQTRLLAATSVYRTRIPDVEERYAAVAARSIGIPMRCFPLDGYSALHSLDAGLWTAEPGPLLPAGMTRDLFRTLAEEAAVALHGHPADAVLAAEPTPYLRTLGPLARTLALLRYTVVKRRPPYFFARDLLGLRRKPAAAPPPDWLRIAPRPRAGEGKADGDETIAVRALRSPMWSSYFEWATPLQTRAPIQLVYPWCDLRVIDAVLAMPPIPWLVDKQVLRIVLRGRVSETIRTRRKTFLQGDPWTAALPNAGRMEIDAASRYIDGARLGAACRAAGSLQDAALRAVAFEYWLRELPSNLARLRREHDLMSA